MVKVYQISYEKTWVYVRTITENDFEGDDQYDYDLNNDPILKSMNDAYHALHRMEIRFISQFLKGQEELHDNHVCMCTPYNSECYRMYRFNGNSWSFEKDLFSKEEWANTGKNNCISFKNNM